MTTIWNATGVTPDATYRVPVDVSSSGAASRVTVQQLADLATLVGSSHNALGSINANTAINLALGPYVSATIAGALTFTITNPPASPNGCEWTLILTNGGSAVVTWPGSITWAGATAPTLTASGVDVLHFASGNGGTNWYGWMETDYAVGTTTGTVAAGDDSRLTDDRTASGLRSATTVVSVSAATAPSSGQVLTATASTTATWQTPTAGGLTKFTEAESTASPNGTVYVDSFTAAGASTNVDFACVPKGTGAFLLAIPDGTAAGGNKRGAGAVDLQLSRSNAAYVASGANSTQAGINNTASGSSSTAFGSANAASGTSSVAIGHGHTASGAYSFASGGFNITSANYAAALGGSNLASGIYSLATGNDATTRGLTGARAHGNGARSAQGDAQGIAQLARATTTNATTTTLTADGAAVGAATVLVLPNNSHVAGLVTITARDSAGNSASWLLFTRVSRGANAASTAVDYQTTVASDLSATLATATAVIAADTTQGALIVSVTGIAATTIDWVADPATLQIVR